MPTRRRRGVLVGLALLVAGVLSGGGATWAVINTRDAPSKHPHRSVVAPARTSGPPTTSHPSPPSGHPGIEPPKVGTWPAAWPSFGAVEPVKTVRHPAGLGFSFRVPTAWECAQAERSDGISRWSCAPGAAPDEGGDVLVRACATPCDAARKIQLRKAENAWDLQWIRADMRSAYAETDTLAGRDGKRRYGLVVVRFWHSRPGGPLDRQLVFRMSAPPDRKPDVQKIMNDIRAATP